MGAYDGYKHAKKKKYTGWKRVACVVGGAVLGAVNPCKIAKAAKSGYKAYKAGKFSKKLRSAYKKVKGGKKQLKKPKSSKTKKYKVKKGRKVSKAKKPGKVTKRHSKKPKPKCFAAGTKISTKDGFKNIEHIKAGDYVWSENPETHEKALKKVKKIFVREKDSIVRLSINGEVIRTTAEHPFYVEGQGFTQAKDLNIGDKVRLKSGETAEVTGIEEEQLKEPIKVYNFEVEDLHTYYVSEQQVLAHNTCGKVTAKKAKTSKTSSVISKGSSSGYKKVTSPLGIGFNTFDEAKKILGSAGEGNAWHHIVEQSQIKNSGFEPQMVHNTNNLIAIPHGKGSVHAQIT